MSKDNKTTPKYEASSDIVTNKKVAQWNHKRKGCQIILHVYFIFRNHAPPKKLREREREREREKEREREYVHQEGTVAEPVEKVLMSPYLIIYIFM